MCGNWNRWPVCRLHTTGLAADPRWRWGDGGRGNRDSHNSPVILYPTLHPFSSPPCSKRIASVALTHYFLFGDFYPYLLSFPTPFFPQLSHSYKIPVTATNTLVLEISDPRECFWTPVSSKVVNEISVWQISRHVITLSPDHFGQKKP